MTDVNILPRPFLVNLSKITQLLAAEAKDVGSLNGILRLAKSALGVFESFSSHLVIKNAISHINAVTDTLKVLKFFHAVSEISDQLTIKTKTPSDKRLRGIKIAAHVNEIVISIMAGINIGRKIGLIDFAKAAKTIGSLPLIGSPLALIPFGGALLIFEGISVAFNITEAALEIKSYDSDQSRIRAKIAQWSDLNSLDKIRDKAWSHLPKTDESTKDFFEKKKIKWENKLYNKPIERKKAQKEIVFNTLLLISIIASIVLGLTGLASLPPVAITLAIGIFLFSIAGLANAVHTKLLLQTKEIRSISVDEILKKV